MAKKSRDGSPTAQDVNIRNAANIELADKGPRLTAEHLREAIAAYIIQAARDSQCDVRDVKCPPPGRWGQGLLPAATRLRLGSPGKYPTAKEAVWGEFDKTQGDMLLPPAVRSGVAKLREYSVWYPPSPMPTNIIAARMVVGRGDSDTFACCLTPPSFTRLNSLQIARTIPGTIDFPTKEEIERATGMKPDLLCPFGMPKSITFCLDLSVMALSEIAMGAGAPDTMLVMPPGELTKLPNAYTVPGLARPKP